MSEPSAPARRRLTLIFVTPSSERPTGGTLALYGFANALARRGHSIHLVHMPMWGRRVTSLADLGRYHFESEIVHYFEGADPASLPSAEIVFGTGADARLGLPVLVVQGFDTLLPNLERDAFRARCLKVCVTSWLVDALAVFGVPRDQLRVAHMGIDHEVFTTTRAQSDRPFDVAMLYGSHNAKGWEVGLRAIHQAKDRFETLRAVVFGTTDPPGELPEWVTFVRDPDLATLVDGIYNSSKVFLQASNYEGFGFTAVEAMACGCALVTTDNGGSRDYADPGRSALVAAPGDAEALGHAIASLLQDDPLREQLASEGAAVARTFDWELGAETLEGHLFDYLADPPRFQGAPGPDEARIATRSQGELAAEIIATTGGDLAAIDVQLG